MTNLKDVLKSIDGHKAFGETDLNVESIHSDSREVQPGSLFVAVEGLTVDGHQFIKKAEESGAIAIVCENLPEEISDKVAYIQVEDSTETLGRIASSFYDNPSEKINLIGITGTNGKTTTATLLYQLFMKKYGKSGLISTIANYINDNKLPTRYTTPDAIRINELLKEMVDAGCKYAFMEVSSHALKQKRIAGLRFRGAIFTNITHEHLDYHKTFRDYIDSKKMLFDNYLDDDSFALINADDRNGKIMIQNTGAKPYTFALKTSADFKGKIIEKHVEGTLINLNGNELWSRFIGTFNAYNLLGVYATAYLLGYDKQELLKDISQLHPVDGRFETIISEDKKTAIVDYAHSPDALENILAAINELQRSSQNLITVIGAGGDRDTKKRPEMAKIAIKYSQKVVLTSDNPRTEDPEAILKEMKKGVKKEDEGKVITIADRKEGIRTACMLAKSEDIILVAGKGHETYQEING
ncbi:MAG: UDP-N-acetylmuramoyl-L-alanyl-D-glutamate--2,6-diaminopimelate ligase, partial [Bacteroidota bacterium]